MAPSPAARGRANGLKRYLDESRELGTSLVLVLPLFIAYQLGVLLTGGVRNGVDFMTDALMLLVGGSLPGYLAVNGVLALVLVGLLLVMRRRGELHPRTFPFVVLESSVYAVFFGAAVIGLIQAIGLGALLATQYSPGNALVLSIGAGLYEEIVFRLFLMGGLFWLLTSVLKRPRVLSAFVALIVSSFIFSAVHHVGSLGEPFTVSAFTFRFFAGVVLAAIYYVRGLAVAVYTHAIYDVLVLVIGAP
jgi:membrane protease YdiL (CAAX protease family)